MNNKIQKISKILLIIILLILVITIAHLVVYSEILDKHGKKTVSDSILPLVYGQEESLIPDWIKAVAIYWIEGSITDEKFIEVLEFLIEHEVIVISGYGKIVEEVIPDKVEVSSILTLATDKDVYSKGETMQISGTLPDYGSKQITFMLISPDNMIVTIGNILPDGNWNYSTTIKLVHNAIDKTGDYVLRLKYNAETVEKTISIGVQ